MATSYQLICSVELLHTYFTNDIMQNYRIAPDEGTQRILKQYGLIHRINQNKMEIYYNSQQLSGAQIADLPRLSFYIMIEDHNFYNYTQLPIDQNQRVYVFENQPGNKSLSKQEFVSEEDIATDDISIPAQAFGLIQLILSEVNEEIRAYKLKFDARRVIWRYFIINRPSSGVSILSIDADDLPSTFIDKGLQTMPNNDQARVFESDPREPIALAEQYTYAVSLKVSMNERESSIRLPYPSAQQVKPVKTEENTLFYSDVYVYI